MRTAQRARWTAGAIIGGAQFVLVLEATNPAVERDDRPRTVGTASAGTTQSEPERAPNSTTESLLSMQFANAILGTRAFEAGSKWEGTWWANPLAPRVRFERFTAADVKRAAEESLVRGARERRHTPKAVIPLRVKAMQQDLFKRRDHRARTEGTSWAIAKGTAKKGVEDVFSKATEKAEGKMVRLSRRWIKLPTIIKLPAMTGAEIAKMMLFGRERGPSGLFPLYQVSYGFPGAHVRGRRPVMEQAPRSFPTVVDEATRGGGKVVEARS